jgi:hypothetical protein
MFALATKGLDCDLGRDCAWLQACIAGGKMPRQQLAQFKFGANAIENHAAQNRESGRLPVWTRPDGARAIGALAMGALACGALALGALAIGRFAVGFLAIRNSRIRTLEIEELDVKHLRVQELDIVGGPATSTSPTPPLA